MATSHGQGGVDERGVLQADARLASRDQAEDAGAAHDHGQEELDERNPEVAAGSVESERRSLDR